MLQFSLKVLCNEQGLVHYEECCWSYCCCLISDPTPLLQYSHLLLICSSCVSGDIIKCALLAIVMEPEAAWLAVVSWYYSGLGEGGGCRVASAEQCQQLREDRRGCQCETETQLWQTTSYLLLSHTMSVWLRVSYQWRKVSWCENKWSFVYQYSARHLIKYIYTNMMLSKCNSLRKWDFLNNIYFCPPKFSGFKV